MAGILPHLSDSEFVDACYRNFLKRAPDAPGRKGYVQRLGQGLSRQGLVVEMVGSEEFRQLLSQGRALLAEADSPFLRFAPPGSYDSPLPSRRLLEGPPQVQALGVPGPESGLDLNEQGQLELLAGFREYYDDLPFTSGPGGGLRYHYENGSFVYFDGIVLYSFLRRFRPRRVIEAGSGYSSALMLDCAERFFAEPPRLTFIDPFPVTLERLLRGTDRPRCRVIARPLQEVPLAEFAELAAGDILFIDSSHVLKFGSDVGFILFELLPRLRPGVLVHFHDIFANFDYPLPWLREGRAWNEGYALRAFLSYNRDFRVMMFNDYIAQRHWPLLQATLPLATRQPAGSPFRNAGVSLWLRKTGTETR